MQIILSMALLWIFSEWSVAEKFLDWIRSQELATPLHSIRRPL